MRKLPVIIATAGLLVSLSACSSTPTLFAGCTPGANASLVTADAKFPTPLISPNAEFSIAKAGDGAQVTDNDVVELSVGLYDGTTGDPLQDAVTIGSFVQGNYAFTNAMSCATIGSTVVATGSAQALLGSGQSAEQQIVVVSKVLDAYPARATGADQVLQPGYPAVVLAPNGRPGITFPSGATPTELSIAALKQGVGKTVKEGDAVVLNLTGAVWGASTTFSSSWDNLAPIAVQASSLADSANGVVPGLAKALIGQQVGSQLVVIAPPSEGYPSGAPLPAGVTAGDTLFFVVDILRVR